MAAQQQEAHMVAAGYALSGDVMRGRPALSPMGCAAIRLWNACGGNVRFPDVLYHMAVDGFEDIELKLCLLQALRAEFGRSNDVEPHR